MRSQAWIVAALVAAAASVEAAPATVKFARYVPAVGSKRTITYETTANGTITQNGKQQPMTQRLTATFTVEVVKAVGTTITKKRVTFSAAHVEADAMGEHEDTDLPLAGKTYIVENSLSHPYAADDGSAITAKERWALSQLRSANVPETPGGLVGGKTFTTGKRVTSRDPLTMLFDLSLTAPADLDLEMTKTDAKTATFTIATKSQGKSLGLAVTSDSKGTLVVSRSRGVPTELTTEGTQSGKGTIGHDAVEIQATVKTHETIEYQ